MLATACPRQLSFLPAPVVFSGPSGLRGYPASIQVQETLVGLLKACLHKPFRCEIRCCHCISLDLNEGKWCNVSATVVPKLNHLKGLNDQNVNQAFMYISTGFSHEQDLFLDLINNFVITKTVCMSCCTQNVNSITNAASNTACELSSLLPVQTFQSRYHHDSS